MTGPAAPGMVTSPVMIDATKVTDQEMRRLTPRQRTVLLRRRAGQPWRRICTDLKLSQAAVKNLVTRATMRLMRTERA